MIYGLLEIKKERSSKADTTLIYGSSYHEITQLVLETHAFQDWLKFALFTLFIL